MAREALRQTASQPTQRQKITQRSNSLGPLLCWAVVFADIGTSVYYTPGILYATVNRLAGFFVFLTMTVFVLLAVKYAEVTHRFPQGGGVVTVAAQGINHWAGAVGGMLILVDYFLTAAISSLSGILYLSVVLPAMTPYAVEITIGALVLLGLLNWVGVSESAKVSMVGAMIAFVSDIAILATVFTHISFSQFLSLFPAMFAHRSLTAISILVGFAGSFLAFSGLESISQLSPVMKTPRKKVGGHALFLVVLTIGLTSPLLTMLSTLLLPRHVLDDPVLSAQVISLLAGHFGGAWGAILQTEVAVSASALLVFASNTAIIGSYHVFMALSRMQFFPAFILKRNKLRGTPHYSIGLATVIPIIVLIMVRGNINILGDMYAFGLLGAFTLTCLGLDIVRYRERKAARSIPPDQNTVPLDNVTTAAASSIQQDSAMKDDHPLSEHDDRAEASVPARQDSSTDEDLPASETLEQETPPSPYPGRIMLNRWYTFKFYIGLLTTALVLTAWTTNLVAKPLATAFGGSVTIVGLAIAYFNYSRHKREGHVPVAITHGEERLPGSILAILTSANKHSEAVIESALQRARGKPVVFLYLGKPVNGRAPQMFEFHDPYHDDKEAQKAFGRAEHLAQKTRVPHLYYYREQEPRAVEHMWRVVHPHEIAVSADDASLVQDIGPDSIRYELTPEGKVMYLHKHW